MKVVYIFIFIYIYTLIVLKTLRKKILISIGRKKRMATEQNLPKSTTSCGHHRPRHLCLPVHLLDRIHIMHKQQLRRHFLCHSTLAAFLIIQLNRQVPEGNRVVGRPHSHYAVIRWMPLDTGNRLAMKGKRRDGRRAELLLCRRTTTTRFPVPQVPNCPLTVIRTRCQEVKSLARPAHDVDIGFGNFDIHRRLARL